MEKETCRKRINFNETCDGELNACNPRIGLTCISKVCKCNSTNQYYDLTRKICVSSCYNDTYTNEIEKTCYICDNKTIYNFKVKACTESCPETYVPDKNRKNCVCPETAKYIENEMCLSECPAGKFPNETSNSCFSCQTNEYFNFHLHECLEVCPKGSEYNETSKTCSCPPGQLLNKNKRKCENKCFPYLRPNEKKRTCECLDFYDFGTDSCVIDCPTDSMIDFSLKSCLTCADSNQFFNRHSLSCVDKCNAIQDKSDQNVCICPLEAQYLSLANYTCYSLCPTGFPKDKLLQTCSCPYSKPYFSTESLDCISNCLNGILDVDTSICHNCTGGTVFNHELYSCSQFCPTGLIKDEIKIECVKCPLEQSFYIEALSQCVNVCPGTTTTESKVCRCPLGKILDVFKLECIPDSDCGENREKTKFLCKCSKESPFLLENKCVKTCPGDFYQDDKTMICLNMNCAQNEFFDINQKVCLDKSECKKPYIYVSEYKKCVPCSDTDFSFYTPSLECVKACVPPFVRSSSDSQLCICRSPTYFFDMELGYCVEKCPSHTFEDALSKSCITCPSTSPYFDISTSKCVPATGCSNKSFLNVATKTCIACPEGYKLLIPAGICLKSCDPSLYEVDVIDNYCKCKNSFYYDFISGTCKESCSNADVDENRKTCKCFGENVGLSEGILLSCGSKCGTSDFYYGFENRCISCDMGKKYAFNSIFSSENCNADSCTSPLTEGNVGSGSGCKCPAGESFVIPDEWQCNTECDESKFMYLDKENYVCNHCPSTSDFFFTTLFKCVSSCPFYAKIYPETRKCSCEGKYPYYDFSSNACVSQCPVNRMVSYSLLKFCDYCDPGKYFDPELYACLDSCGELKKTNMLTRKCEACSENELMISHTSECLPESQSDCPQGFQAATQGVCQCPQYYVKEAQSCANTCPDGFSIDQQKKLCFCSKFINSYTIFCEDISSCPLGADIIEDNICLCGVESTNIYFNPYTSKCEASCPDGATDTDNVCICDEKFNLITNKCEASCPSNLDISVKDIQGQNLYFCSCPKIFPYILDGTCTGIISEKSFVDPLTSKIFKCKENEYLVKTFPPSCETVCPNVTLADSVSQACECPNNEFFEPSSSSCVSSCPINSHADKTTKVCVDCKNFFYDVTSFRCVASCPAGLKTDLISRTCRCSDTSNVYIRETEQCEAKCPQNALDYKTSCACSDTSYLSADSSMCMDPTQCQALNREKKKCESCTDTFNFHTATCSTDACSDPLQETGGICQCPSDKLFLNDISGVQCVDSCGDDKITKTLSKFCEP
ncbi:unnamed protein product [Brachionus calyciflorus]|uniref:EGF-like domain-containing protein n=1 Tax=Brachionus calyciflorus TaxID=104777 RepID=A0A813Y8H5_9BILA|nr:unnamed protein product [Brachionus calyciflorus]